MPEQDNNREHIAASTPQGVGAESELPGYARTLSWLSLLFILLTNLGLSFFISNSARDTLLGRQTEFARLLVQNINSQIFHRFAIPTLFKYDRISLYDNDQRQRLDDVVQSITRDLPIERVRIYTYSRHVVYSTRKEEFGRAGIAPANIGEVFGDNPTPSTELISAIPDWQAPFRFPLQPGTFVLRILIPMQNEYIDAQGRQLVRANMGALEVFYDMTGVYEQVLTFQGIIVVMCLLSSLILFGLLLMLIHRSERVLSHRVQKNRELENALHNNEKLASMGRVVASIAHEIRNPLGIIRSTAELLQRKTDKADASTQRLLGAIYDESLRLSQTVNDFLDYARPRQPRQDLVDVNLVLDHALAFLEGEFSRREVGIERTVEDAALYVLGDKDLLYRAFYNILVNGQQAMDGPGIVQIRVAPGGDEGDPAVVVEFLDSGPGFDPETKDNLLDPFFTTKEGGTGLGLPIVNSIITSHGGRIELENGPNGGALVRVVLPAAPDDGPDSTSL